MADFTDYVNDEEELKRRLQIAAPGVANPAASLPGVDVPKISSQRTADEAELKRLNDTGSGVSQFAKRHNPVIGGLARAGDVALSVLTPRVARDIPGTSMHHEALVNQQRGAIGQDVKQEGEQAQTAEAQARVAQSPSVIAKNEADATESKARAKVLENPQAKPPNTDFELWHQQNPQGTAEDWMKLQQKNKPEPKPDNPEQQFLDEYQKMHPGSTVAQAQHAYAQNHQVTEPGNFMPLYDEKGHVSGAWDPKSGRVVNQPNLPGNTSQGHGIEQHQADAQTKQLKPYQDMVDEASQAHQLKDMGDKGNAPADVDLALSFFKVMRSGGSGQGGIRFTQQEQQMILGARNSAGDLLGLAQKVMGGGQALTPDQRQKMVEVIDMHAHAAQQAMQRLQNPNGAPAQGQPDNGGRRVVDLTQ